MRAILLGVLIVLSGCAADPYVPSKGLREQVNASFVRVVDGRDADCGVAVVVRATYDRVLLVLGDSKADSGQRFLAFGEERVPTQARAVAGLTVLEAARAERDLRAVHGARRPVAGEFVFVYGGRDGRFDHGVASVLRSSEAAVELLVTWGEGSDVETLIEEVGTGVVMSPEGSLVGLLPRRSGDARPRVIPFARFEGELLGAASIPGAEHMWPGDGFLPYRFWVRSPAKAEEVPPVADEWGTPDYFLVLEQEQRRVSRTPIYVTPRRDSPPELVWLTSRRALRARLVERDVTLTGGDAEEDLAPPVGLNATRAGVTCTFEALPHVVRGYPQGVGPRETKIDLSLDPVDPERASGPDRTPLGARRHGLGRVARGQVDWVGGDATDFWSVDVEQGGPILCFLFRERPDTELRLEAFAPGIPEPVLATPALPDRRLVVARAKVSGGRVLVRVRQVGGGSGRSGYSLFLVPAGEQPGPLVRVLLRLIARQDAGTRSFMGSRQFAREVHQAFVEEAGLDPTQLADAFLDALSERTPEARALVMHMLHAHVRPPLERLEELRRAGVSDASTPSAAQRGAPERSRDAALLLALRCTAPREFNAYLHTLAAVEGLPPGVLERGSPNRDPKVVTRLREEAKVILYRAVIASARDASPMLRMVALSAASRWRDQPLRRQLEEELKRLLAQDPSARVRRALERAFPPEQIQRRRRVRQRSRTIR